MKTVVLASCLVIGASSFAFAAPTVFFVRHAEKAPDVNHGGDPDLSAAGKARAESLAQMLKDAKITAIFVTQFKRTQETAAPLAKSLGLIPTVIPAKDFDALDEKLRALQGNALVIGHGDTIPHLLRDLGIKESIVIPETDFTEMFVVALGENPEMLRLHY